MFHAVWYWYRCCQTGRRRRAGYRGDHFQIDSCGAGGTLPYGISRQRFLLSLHPAARVLVTGLIWATLQRTVTLHLALLQLKKKKTMAIIDNLVIEVVKHHRHKSTFSVLCSLSVYNFTVTNLCFWNYYIIYFQINKDNHLGILPLLHCINW